MAARRPQHKAAHDPCPNGVTSWAACDQATAEARGRCASLTERATECTNWAVDTYEGAGYCGTHYAGRVNAAIERAKSALRQAELDERIDRYMAWSAEHPSVWDRMPSINADDTATVVATEAPVSRPRLPDGVVWRASSGSPVPPVQPLRKSARVLSLA